MDNRVKWGVLVVAGGVGVYLIWKGKYLQQWFPALFGPAGAVAAPGAAAAEAARVKAAQAAAAAAADPTNAQKAAEARKALDDAAAAKKKADDAAAAAAKKKADDAAAAHTVNCTQELRLCPDGSPMGRAADCTWLPASCAPAHTPIDPVPPSRDEQVSRAAAAAGAGPLLNMDQWCYYSNQLGFTCPDPGSIPPEIYAGAFYADTDRTTPVDLATWSALVDWAAGNPGSLAGLSGRQLMGLGWCA